MNPTQSTTDVLMIEPVNFFSDLPNTSDNKFQSGSSHVPDIDLQALSLAEFAGVRELLITHGINVTTYRDLLTQRTPDSIFPNNWFSTFPDGTLVIYPMRAETRRREKRSDIISDLSKRYPTKLDLSDHEQQDLYLEGTGSLVLDRVHKVAYACISQRTSIELVRLWCNKFGFEPVIFHAFDQDKHPIYHTNVVMTVGSGYCLICLECITNKQERDMVADIITRSGLATIEISLSQVQNFCGNALELSTMNAKKVLVMSDCAACSLTASNRKTLSEYVKVLSTPIPTIEKYGGGGVRCMLAELF